MIRGNTPKIKKRPGRRPVSCAECRRLKLRCDRKVPCDNCAKRGCSVICPDGSLTQGRGNRLVLSDTKELHDDIDSLIVKIRHLESALGSMQSSVSAEPHPLLQKDLLDIKDQLLEQKEGNDNVGPSETGRSRPSEGSDNSGRPILKTDASGTLSIGQNGEMHFLGQTARADFLLQKGKELITEHRSLPPEFYENAWPEAPISCMDGKFDICDALFPFLPPFDVACTLSEVFLEFDKWLGPCITRQQIYDELLVPIYVPLPDSRRFCAHNISLLFMVFSLGVLWDTTRPAYAPEADNYYHLARAALSFKSPVENTTLAAVQSVIQMVRYLEFSDSPQGSMRAWPIMGIAIKLAFSMGLHRDSSQWKLEGRTAARRHATFWQLYTLDATISFSMGRPSSITAVFVDCPIPEEHETVESDADQPNFWRWKIEFVKFIGTFCEQVFGCVVPTYGAVLGIDRKVREQTVTMPDWLKITQNEEENAKLSPRVKMQRWEALRLQESMFFYLHRGYLILALDERLADLSKSRFYPSVIACYRSAFRIISCLKSMYHQLPTIITRDGGNFASAVSSAIVMCLLVTRAPMSKLALPAMDKLSTVCEILEVASTTNKNAQRNLAPMMKYRDQARDVLAQSQQAAANGELQRPVVVADDGLDRLGGKTSLTMNYDYQRVTRDEERAIEVFLESGLDPRVANVGSTFSPSFEGSRQGVNQEQMNIGVAEMDLEFSAQELALVNLWQSSYPSFPTDDISHQAASAAFAFPRSQSLHFDDSILLDFGDMRRQAVADGGGITPQTVPANTDRQWMDMLQEYGLK
ncbi:fungal-specific transcription factor domain-containing protein [Phellopilus nigrolimitatus]|nr:fungal-specific transcription factor domain-containing protein [Phellopilus nigrolimitatus]